MSKKHLTPEEELKLDTFLKHHNPRVPDPGHDAKRKLMAAVAPQAQITRPIAWQTFWKWMGSSLAAACALALVVWVGSRKLSHESFTEDAYEAWSDLGDVDSENAPEDEWLELAGL